ncbi:MAG: hypothetical protein ACI9JD_002908 [Rhodococcus sp. (in: high G+C Gram-positive bacteria)]
MGPAPITTTGRGFIFVPFIDDYRSTGNCIDDHQCRQPSTAVDIVER